ncbi:hypothetical protein [Pimelobacter simplex]|uniref:hypothetical protein n=1 Tax=Nocardioides simplex TaxID=2045 RepID=UPI001932DA2F|nr:hypothetical protein [Pimelobacter simplex]
MTTQSRGAKMANVSRKVLGHEWHMFFAYVFIVFRPGANPPTHPQADDSPPALVPKSWTHAEFDLYIAEARLDVANQQAEKRDIRARAQIILTTAIILGGTIAASYGNNHDLCLRHTLLYIASAAFTTLAGLGAAGIISGKSFIGTVSVPVLPQFPTGELHHAVATGYATHRKTGAETVATLVTVLRICVLTLVLGAFLLAIAHVTS